ncbi:MAG: phage terminase large subunit [Bacteroidaceae bacterium]|nr:phage terminase large subunit [Bacteroidaceae bacterium]
MANLNIDLSGDKLLPHQRKLIKSKCKKTALICGRGAGKSYACAALILLTLLIGKNVLVGGQRYETLQTTLYADIKNLAHEWGLYDYITWRMSPMMMVMGDAHVWFGSYESIDAVRGYSRVSLIVLDEMFLAPCNILSVWGPCMRATPDGKTRIVGATTPRAGSLWNVMFADPKNDWEVITAVTTDNKYIAEEEYKLILSGITSDEMYKQEILGLINTDLGGAAIIKLGQFPQFPAPTSDNRVIAGLDCAEGVERDCTAFVKRRGNEILEMWKLSTIDHEETVRRIRESNRRLKIDTLNMDAAFSDYEYNILKYEMSCEQVNFARAATEENKEKYANVRAEMYFNLAWHIKHGLCCDGFDLTPELKRQMCAITWLHNNQGRLLLTKKEELRAALKMSTDIADALALTCLDRYTADDPQMQQKTEDNHAKHRDYARRLMG